MRYIFLILTTFIAFALVGQTAEDADVLHAQGRDYFAVGKIAEGRAATKQAMEIRRQLFGEVSEDYITSLNNYALSYTFEENYTKAIELQQQVLELCVQLPAPHPLFGTFSANQGRNYYLVGDQTSAVKYWETALAHVEKFGDEYEMLLNWIALYYSEQNDLAKIEWVMALMEEHNQHELSKECNEPQCMLERAEYYGVMGDNVKARECFLKVFSMDMTDEMRVKAHSQYAIYLHDQQDFVASAEQYALAAVAQRKIDGNSDKYAHYSYQAALRFFLGKEYQRAITLSRQVINIYASIDTPEGRLREAECLTVAGNSYRGMGKNAEAIEAFKKVVAYYEANNQESENYPKAIERLAVAEKFNKDYDASIAHYKQAIALFEQRDMMREYSDAVNGLKLCYAYAGIDETVEVNQAKIDADRTKQLDKLIQEESANLELTKTYLGKNRYSHSLSVIAGCNLMKGDYRSATEFYKQYIPAVRDAMRDEFRMQDAGSRMIVWGEHDNSFKQLHETLVTMPKGDDALMDELAAVVYDAELLAKGILLNSSIEFEKVLRARGDQAMLDVYAKIAENDIQIENLRMNAASDDDSQTLIDLQLENEQLQLQLYKGCAEVADFTNYLSYTWQDVQMAMQPDDVAIEFLAVESTWFDADNYMYALVLTKDMAKPVALKICTLEDANDMVDAENLFEVDMLLWGALKSYLDGKQRIFFAADHAFNRVGIEYLSYGSKPLSEQFEVYRLSSTKELCMSRKAVDVSKVALFGDINYNEYAVYTGDAQRSVAAMRGPIYGNLDFSKIEVEKINDLLSEKNIDDIAIFTDTIASKTAFLNLSDSKVNVLHVATHGAYKEVAKASDAESMTNSVLVFAGANLTDSCLVSAAEVAKMNLRYCDLAVLSACETGLGKLGTDGVFGLQRGFKNAGVRSLLMSLKNVYDSSTAEMMISFYANLMEGQSKREALVNAQRKIRANGYNEPKYWATFILLDAL